MISPFKMHSHLCQLLIEETPERIIKDSLVWMISPTKVHFHLCQLLMEKTPDRILIGVDDSIIKMHCHLCQLLIEEIL